jgi:hypothetical protein
MPNQIGGPNSSGRQRALQDLQKNLDAQADKNLKEAGAEIREAGNEAKAGAADASGAAVNVVRGTVDAVDAAGSAAAGTALGLGAVAAKLMESFGDLIGRGLQLLGKGFVGAGNAARELADRGGQQFTTKDIAGDKFAQQWSDVMLLEASGDAFEHSAAALQSSIAEFGGAAVNTVRAATHLVSAAALTLAAGKDLADAGALKTLELAAAALEVAVEKADQGVDISGALMQELGKAMIAVGNNVNTARGTDTAVAPA